MAPQSLFEGLGQLLAFGGIIGVLVLAVRFRGKKNLELMQEQHKRRKAWGSRHGLEIVDCPPDRPQWDFRRMPGLTGSQVAPLKRIKPLDRAQILDLLVGEFDGYPVRAFSARYLLQEGKGPFQHYSGIAVNLERISPDFQIRPKHFWKKALVLAGSSRQGNLDPRFELIGPSSDAIPAGLHPLISALDDVSWIVLDQCLVLLLNDLALDSQWDKLLVTSIKAAHLIDQPREETSKTDGKSLGN